MQLQLKDDEQVIKQAEASYQMLSGSVPVEGGKLMLTNQRLVFVKYRNRSDSDLFCVDLPCIDTLQKKWTKLFFLPIKPNSLQVFTLSKKKYNFVVEDRAEWLSAIKQQNSFLN